MNISLTKNNIKKTILFSLILVSMLLGSQLLLADQAEATHQSISTTQFLGGGAGCGFSSCPDALNFTSRLTVSGPASVAPNETFSISGVGMCNGDDASGNANISGNVPGWGSFGSTGLHPCPPAIGYSVGNVSITAPSATGPFCVNFFVTTTKGNPPMSYYLQQPTHQGEFCTNVVAAPPPWQDVGCGMLKSVINCGTLELDPDGLCPGDEMTQRRIVTLCTGATTDYQYQCVPDAACVAPPPPWVNLTSAVNVIDEGDNLDLTWAATNATACYGNGIGGFSGSVGTNGPWALPTTLADGVYVFGIYCDGPGGRFPASGYDTRTITINPVASPPPWVNLSSATNIIDEGDPLDLTWAATNATACYGNGVGGFSGSVGTNGPWALPTTLADGVYVFGIYCDGPGGRFPASGYDTRTITINPVAAPPTCSLPNVADFNTVSGQSCIQVEGCDTDNFDVRCQNPSNPACFANWECPGSPPPWVNLTSATNIIDEGDPLDLTWAATNATACYGNGVGGFSGSVGVNGPWALPTTLADGVYVFGIYCDGPGGRFPASGYDTRTITINPVGPPVCTTGPVVNLGGFGPAFPEWDTCEYATLGDNALMDREPGSSVSSFASPCRDYMCIDCMTDTITYKGIGRSYVDVTCGGAPAPAITVSPVDLDFGSVETGSTRTLQFVVSNTGGGTLNVDANPVISGAFAARYSCISANCTAAQSITSASPQTYTVEYAPTVESNNQTATLTLTGSNFANQPITLTGNGVVPATCVLGARSIFGEATTQDCNNAALSDTGTLGANCPGNAADTVLVSAWNSSRGGSESACLHTNNCPGAGNIYAFINSCAGGPPAPTAAFTSPLAVAVDSGNNVTVTWTSSNAANCELYDTTNTATLSGLNTADSYTFNNVTTDTEYSVRCQNASSVWSANSANVVVTINAPATCVLGSSQDQVEGDETVCNNTRDLWTASPVTCPGNPSDTVAEADWLASRGAVGCLLADSCAVGANEFSYIDSCVVGGVPGCTDPTANNYNAAATVNDGSCTYDPTATVEVSVNGGAWTGTNQTIDVGDTVVVRWDSTYAVNCTGNANVPTGGATDSMPAGIAVAEPAGGSFLDYTVTCDDGAVSSPPDTVRVTTNPPPNLTIGFVEDATYPSLTPEVDGLGNITGNYTDATVRVIVSETAGVAITDTFAVEIELDLNDDGTPDVTYVVPGGIAGIAASGAIPLIHTFSTIIPIAPQSRITARVDTPLASNGVITETIDTVADNSDDLFPLPLGLPPIDMELLLDPSDLVRGGGNVDIDYDVNATFSMTCELYGPGLATHTFNPSTDGPSGSLTAGPISSKSVYTLSCTELVTGANQVFTESASVETTGTVEEI